MSLIFWITLVYFHLCIFCLEHIIKMFLLTEERKSSKVYYKFLIGIKFNLYNSMDLKTLLFFYHFINDIFRHKPSEIFHQTEWKATISHQNYLCPFGNTYVLDYFKFYFQNKKAEWKKYWKLFRIHQNVKDTDHHVFVFYFWWIWKNPFDIFLFLCGNYTSFF